VELDATGQDRSGSLIQSTAHPTAALTGGITQLRTHLQLFVDACNHARRLKTLRGLTPYEFICQARAKEPDRFRLDPSHYMPGPYS
jgi:hypothetical protein